MHRQAYDITQISQQEGYYKHRDITLFISVYNKILRAVESERNSVLWTFYRKFFQQDVLYGFPPINCVFVSIDIPADPKWHTIYTEWH